MNTLGCLMVVGGMVATSGCVAIEPAGIEGPPRASLETTWPILANARAPGRFERCGDWPLPGTLGQCYSDVDPAAETVLRDHACYTINEGWRDVTPYLIHKHALSTGCKYHYGSDWNFGSGNEDGGRTVYAIADGWMYHHHDPSGDTPVSKCPRGTWGDVLFTTHEDAGLSYTAVYAHVAPLPGGFPTQNRPVTKGEPIAVIDPTAVQGCWEFSHLHFEIREGLGNIDLSAQANPWQLRNDSPPAGQLNPLFFICLRLPGVDPDSCDETRAGGGG